MNRVFDDLQVVERIDAEAFDGLQNREGENPLPVFEQNARHVGDVILFLRVVGAERAERREQVRRIENIVTHVGLLPENPSTTEYYSLVNSLRELANYVKNNGQYFLFETGQETPVTLKRIIEDIGTGNLGINLDPANLILYGKANPVDALDVFGEYVRDVHAKDGKYPTDGKNLGVETPIGEGKVNFPEFVKKLKEVGYNGPLTIEREISGEQQIKDIVASKKYLEELI